MKLKPRVFLDLEGTVINNWEDRDLEWRKVQALKKMLLDGDIRCVELFSFAIYDEEDRKKFTEMKLANTLTDALGVDVTAFPLTVDQIKEDIQRVRGLFFEDRREFIHLLGKQEGFLQWCQTQPPGDFILVDDMVHNILFEDHTTKHKVAIIHIDTVCEEFE